MILDDAEFFKLALNSYDSPFTVSVEEFSADLKRLTHLNNLLKRFEKNRDDLKDRLIMNHIVILGNCFTPEKSILLMRYKIESRITLDTFLYYMGLIACADKLDLVLLDVLEKVHGKK